MKNWICNLFLVAFVLLWAAPSDAASRFLVACTTACTWDASNTVIWSATSGGAGGQSVPGSSDTVTLDANTCVGGLTCTITVNTTVTVQSITMGACTASTTGCILDFSANNNNVTLSTSFSGAGTGTRTLNMGNGTWTISATSGVPWDYATVTNLTHNANSSSLIFTSSATASRTFSSGGKTFNSVSIVNTASNSAAVFDISGGPTFSSFSLTSPILVRIAQSTTLTVSNAFSIAGSAFNSVIDIQAQIIGTTSTISVPSGNATFSWAAIKGLSFTGGATFTATNSFNLQGNTGITITGPAAGGSSGHIIGG